ncbi:MAG: iron-sulfur-binding reductase, partial [Peptococcaceae bacterium]|nr:iron-sulfur-binding reductase [Peptococcaceae bacterium]
MTPTPTRQLYWNIQGEWLIYPLFAVSLLILAYGFYQRYSLWQLGQHVNRNDKPSTRLKTAFDYVITQRKILREKEPGLMHLLIFWGMLVLFLGTVVVAMQSDLGLQIMHGGLYLYFESFALNLFGLGVLIGLLIALFRRYIQKPDGIDSGFDDGVVLGLLLLIVITVFVLRPLR